MGWSKRGNGWSYDSLNGYAAIIGFLSHKVLDFTTRNRQCYLCDKGHKKHDHDCRKNFEGSAKAMEASAGAQLVNESKILQEVDLHVRVVIGDEDSSTIAAIRKGTKNKVHKLADNNHLVKNFGNELYDIAKSFKELNKPGVIAHLKKCFSYAISQNKNSTENLSRTIGNIPDHMFNKHENCGSWCKRENQDSLQTFVLQDPDLYDKLVDFFTKYARNAAKFSVAASSQANESLNSVIASKAPKSRCYSKSESADYRVACAVLAKNEGDIGLLAVKKKLGVTPGFFTSKFCINSDKLRKYKSMKKVLKKYKLRRLELTAIRKNMRKTKEKKEGITYQRNSGINLDPDTEIQTFSYEVVYFDLETSGFAMSDDILQIAAICKDREFNVYINPTQSIPSNVTKVNSLSVIRNKLCYKGVEVNAMNLRDALLSFSEFLKSVSSSCILVAHNGYRFDFPRLINATVNTKLIDDYSMVIKCSDTIHLFKKTLPERQGPGALCLLNLARNYLNLTDESEFHEALFDVKTLRDLVVVISNENLLFTNSKSFNDLIEKVYINQKISSVDLTLLKPIISRDLVKKIALAGFDINSLKEIYKKGGENEIVKIFTEKCDFTSKPVVTKDKKALKKVTDFLKSSI